MSIVIERLDQLEALTLDSGAHASFEQGACIMEAAAWVAGETFSDHPKCVCPVIGAFLRAWNDGVDNDFRQRLKPYIPLVIGTADSHSQERSWLAMDWMIREYLPTWLELAKITDIAAALRKSPPILGPTALGNVTGLLASASEQSAAAWAAAWDAAWDAARAAVRAAVRDALTPTVQRLQESAFGLLDRMIALGASERRAA